MWINRPGPEKVGRIVKLLKDPQNSYKPASAEQQQQSFFCGLTDRQTDLALLFYIHTGTLVWDNKSAVYLR